MSLIKCKECNGQVSSKAKICPGCGARVPKKVGVLGWLLVLFVVLPIAWIIGGKMSSIDVQVKAPEHQTEKILAVDAPKFPTENWKRSEYKDAMTDVKTQVSSIKSKNSTYFEFPYAQPGGSRLSLSFRTNAGKLDAYMRIDKGQMICHSGSCSFNLRVGDDPVQRWTAIPSSTHDSDLMFVRDAKKLESIVRSGKPIRVGIQFYQAGERVFEFDPAGYPDT